MSEPTSEMQRVRAELTALRGEQIVTLPMDVQKTSRRMAALIDASDANTERDCPDTGCEAFAMARHHTQVPGDHVVPGVLMHRCPKKWICTVVERQQRYRGTGGPC